MIVSVVMPAYNAEKTIKESVDSVLAQTFTDFELIITDDCSSDKTPAIYAGLVASDPRIRVLRNEANKGVAAARNKGVAEARGEWIAFLDSDDLWRPDKLEKHMAFIKKTGADISYTASAFIDGGGAVIDYILPAEYRLTYAALLRRNLMSCSSVMVRRGIMLDNGFQSGPIHEDYSSWLRILKKTGAAYGLDEPLLVYRVSKNSRSGRLVRSGMMSYRTYKAVGYGVIPSLFLTSRYALHSLKKRGKMRRGVRAD